jgi:hypothetical protein
VIAMAITLIVILILFWMCFGLPEYVKRMWQRIPPSAWHQVSDDDEILGTADSRERAEARQCHVRGPSTVFERLRKTTKPRTVRAGKRYKKRWW